MVYANTRPRRRLISTGKATCTIGILASDWPAPSNACYAEAIRGQRNVQLADNMKYGTPFWDTPAKTDRFGDWVYLNSADVSYPQRDYLLMAQYVTTRPKPSGASFRRKDWQSYWITPWQTYFTRFNKWIQFNPYKPRIRVEPNLYISTPSGIRITVSGGGATILANATISKPSWYTSDSPQVYGFWVQPTWPQLNPTGGSFKSSRASYSSPWVDQSSYYINRYRLRGGMVECRLVVYEDETSFTAPDVSVMEPEASGYAEIPVGASWMPSHGLYRIYYNTITKDASAGDTATAGEDYTNVSGQYILLSGARSDPDNPRPTRQYGRRGGNILKIGIYHNKDCWGETSDTIINLPLQRRGGGQYKRSRMQCGPARRVWAHGSLSYPWSGSDSRTATIKIPILADTTVEGDETFRVAFRPTLNTTDDGEETIVTVTILDDDTPAAQITDTVIDEGDVEHTILVPVVLSETPAAGSSVSVTAATWDGVDGDTSDTPDATATAGVDYEVGSWPLVFTPSTPGNFLTVPVKVFGDTDVEEAEFFYVRVGTSVGKVTLSNDDLIVWKPNPNVITPAGANPDGEYDYLVGSPVFVWLSNVAETCEPVTALPVLTGTDRGCGDDVWARDWSDATLWSDNFLWQTGEDGQEAVIYTADRIVIDRGDGFAPHVCYSDHATNPTRRGTAAPGRRLTYDRINLGLSNIQPGECVYQYYKSGEYTLTITVIWNEYVCKPSDLSLTKDQIAVNPKGFLTCAVPVERETSFSQKVNVVELHQEVTT